MSFAVPKDCSSLQNYYCQCHVLPQTFYGESFEVWEVLGDMMTIR